MDKIKEYALSKINLTLDVGAARPDGYHEMRMVMQSLDLGDDVEISLKDTPGIMARSNLRYLPSDGRNLAVQAAQVFFRAAKLEKAGAEIKIFKRIPVCAGMGGGSSDAAAVLRGLNSLTKAGFSPEKLEELGRSVGSDVPFCVQGGLCLATGRGEVLQSLPPLPEMAFVLCKPPFSVSTPELFRLIDRRRNAMRPDTEGMISAIESGDLMGISRRVYNVFEDALPPHRARTVWEIKRQMLDLGALAACMTGTGPTVFAVFPNRDSARTAFEKLSETWGNCFLAKPDSQHKKDG